MSLLQHLSQNQAEESASTNSILQNFTTEPARSDLPKRPVVQHLFRLHPAAASVQPGRVTKLKTSDIRVSIFTDCERPQGLFGTKCESKAEPAVSLAASLESWTTANALCKSCEHLLAPSRFLRPEAGLFRKSAFGMLAVCLGMRGEPGNKAHGLILLTLRPLGLW